MAAQKGPRILTWDLETAGVRGLCADQGYIVCFGYKFLGDEKPKVLTLLDYPGKNCQDDRELLKAAQEIMCQADLLVAHYGDKFDRPYLETRLLISKLPPIPIVRQVDTCYHAQKRLKLSSNRLGNLAAVLGVKTPKMEKRGGWPSWWMGALRGDEKSIRLMAAYCAIDVQCLEECYLRMRHVIPQQYLYNHAIGSKLLQCGTCGAGSHKVHSKGYYVSDKRIWKRYECRSCWRTWKANKPEPV